MTSCPSDFLSALILIFLFQNVISYKTVCYFTMCCWVQSRNWCVTLSNWKKGIVRWNICNRNGLESGPGDILLVLFAAGDGEMWKSLGSSLFGELKFTFLDSVINPFSIHIFQVYLIRRCWIIFGIVFWNQFNLCFLWCS